MPNTWKHLPHNSITGARYQGDEGGWEQFGVEWGNSTKPIVVWHKDAEYVVFKVPAGRYFRNIADRQHSTPGCFVVCQLIEDKGDTLITEELFTMPVSKRSMADA
jgi:hypothetical protein